MIHLGPDYVRLKFRYEVSNGTSEITEINTTTRIMSYAMVIGNTPEIQKLITVNSMPIKPTMWYD